MPLSPCILIDAVISLTAARIRALQEAVADELEEAYRSGVWLPERGRLNDFHGTQAARVPLLTLSNEMKVHALHVATKPARLHASAMIKRQLRRSLIALQV